MLPRAVQTVVDNEWNRQNSVNMDEFKHAIKAQQSSGNRLAGNIRHAPIELPSRVDSNQQLCTVQNSRSITVNEASGTVQRVVLRLRLGAYLSFFSLALSQVRLVTGEDDAIFGGELFPANALDADGQQVDLRSQNTWSSRAHEVGPNPLRSP